jgi:hypothetical protein
LNTSGKQPSTRGIRIFAGVVIGLRGFASWFRFVVSLRGFASSFRFVVSLRRLASWFDLFPLRLLTMVVQSASTGSMTAKSEGGGLRARKRVSVGSFN